MSRKSKKRRAKKRKAAAPAKFTLGTQVQVKHGTTVPDFSDIPLGGWSGTISDVDDSHKPPTYLIEWNKRTLAAMHPVYRKRCERDDLEAESMWLGEDDIEPDAGEPVTIEQPTQIIVRPLQMSDQDDRIRAIFGLTSDDPLPPVDDEHLRKYHEHLAAKLQLPFSASYSEEVGFLQDRRHPITVTALLDADDSDDEDGLLCEAQEDGEEVVLPLAQIEKVAGANRQLVDDYGYWFINWQGAGVANKQAWRPHEIEKRSNHTPAGRRGLVTALSRISLLSALHGAGIGAALASLDGALMAAQIGAVLLGVIVGWLGLKDGHRNRYWFGSVVGLCFGAVLGMALGIMVVAFIGTLIGAVLGGVLWLYLGSRDSKVGRTMFGAMAGATLGIGVQSWLHAGEDALSGALVGGVVGAVAGPVLFVGMIFATVIVSIRQERG